MQSAEERDGASAAVRLDRARNWRVLGYREVGARLVVVFSI
jgi:hypothetical protein